LIEAIKPIQIFAERSRATWGVDGPGISKTDFTLAAE